MRVLKRRITLPILACIFLTGLTSSHRAMASNRAVNLKMVEKPGQTTFLFDLETKIAGSFINHDGALTCNLFRQVLSCQCIEKGQQDSIVIE